MWGPTILIFLISAVLTLADFSILQTTTVNGLTNTESFVKIGDKYYYIEDKSKHNWFDAAHQCRRHNAHLAFIERESELNEISNYLKGRGYGNDDWFWISANDLMQEGHFYSIATGHPLSYMHWSTGQPDNYHGNENCVHLWLANGTYKMNDRICTSKVHFICQLDNPRSIVFTVW